VRIAAAKLLGEMPDDQQVVLSLQDHLTRIANATSREQELTETAKALSRHVYRNQRLRTDVLRNVIEHLPKGPNSHFGDATAQHHLLGLLLVCESIGGVADDATARRLYALAESYKTPLAIRRQALRVYGRICPPSVENLELIVKLLRRNDLRMNETTYAAAASFVTQSRRKVEYVRRIYSNLGTLRDTLSDAWQRETARPTDSIDPPGLRDIREAVVEVEQLMLAYEEFAGRATLTVTA